MPSRPVLLTCLLLIAGARLALADPRVVFSTDSAWQRGDEKDGVAMYWRTRVGSSIKEFKGVGLISAPPATVENVLRDVADYPSFMPYIAESRILSHAGDETITYQRLSLPFIASRDYTLRIVHGITKNAAGLTAYRDTWQTDNDAGPPPRLATVRVKVSEGSWLLEPAAAGGTATKATYQIYTDSGGALPVFVANHGSQLAIPKLYDAIRSQVHDPKYQHSDPAD